MEKIESNNKKAGAGLSLLLISALTLATLPMMIACGDDGKEEQGEQAYGTIDGIKVYIDAGVADMTTAFGNVETAYNALDPTLEQPVLAGKINEIRIKAGSGLSRNGTTLTIGENESVINIFNYMADIINNIAKGKSIRPFEYAKLLSSKDNKFAQCNIIKKNMHFNVAKRNRMYS